MVPSLITSLRGCCKSALIFSIPCHPRSLNPALHGFWNSNFLFPISHFLFPISCHPSSLLERETILHTTTSDSFRFVVVVVSFSWFFVTWVKNSHYCHEATEKIDKRLELHCINANTRTRRNVESRIISPFDSLFKHRVWPSLWLITTFAWGGGS